MGSRTLRIPSPMLECLSPCMAARTHHPGPPKHLGASDSERMMMLLPCLCLGVVIGKAHAMLPSQAIPAAAWASAWPSHTVPLPIPRLYREQLHDGGPDAMMLPPCLH